MWVWGNEADPAQKLFGYLFRIFFSCLYYFVFILLKGHIEDSFIFMTVMRTWSHKKCSVSLIPEDPPVTCSTFALQVRDLTQHSKSQATCKTGYRSHPLFLQQAIIGSSWRCQNPHNRSNTVLFTWNIMSQESQWCNYPFKRIQNGWSNALFRFLFWFSSVRFSLGDPLNISLPIIAFLNVSHF